MDAVLELSTFTGIGSACDALGVARASLYRKRPVLGPVEQSKSCPVVERDVPPPARSLSPAERALALGCLHEERFQDRSPAAVYATLLDEGVYHCLSLARGGGRIWRAPRSTHASRLSQARATRHWSQSALELGHHQVDGPRQVDLLLPLRHHGCFQQPLCRWLDDRAS